MTANRLFIKVFVGFWLVCLAVLLSWTVSIRYFDAQPPIADVAPGEPPPRFLLRLVYSLQNSPRDELADIVARVRDRHGVDVYLFTPDGQEFLGQNPAPEVKQLARQLAGTRRRAWQSIPGGRMVAHRLLRAGEQPMAAVMVLPRPRRPLLAALQNNQGLRIGIAVLVSGLACYGLSLLLTRRLQSVQLASRQLAEGDLTTRIPVAERGGDETAQLARDFNHMADQLEQTVHARERMLHDVSHELRSPLARMRIALALAQREHGNSTELDRIEREAERLDVLIGQLLSVPEAQLPLDETVDLVARLQALVADAEFEAQAAGKSAVLVSTLESAPLQTHGDLLEKALNNVLRNAVTYTVFGSTVSVELSHSEDGYRIDVSDNGPGVPEAELSRLFDPFYRVDTARSRDTGGHGLGLAIARRAMEQHGGSITAENRHPGLRVSLRFPGSGRDSAGDNPIS